MSDFQKTLEKHKDWLQYFTNKKDFDWDGLTDEDLLFIIEARMDQNYFLENMVISKLFPESIVVRMLFLIFQRDITLLGPQALPFVHQAITTVKLDDFLFESYMKINMIRVSPRRHFLQVDNEVVENHFRKHLDLGVLYYYTGSLPHNLTPLIKSSSNDKKLELYANILQRDDDIDLELYDDMKNLVIHFENHSPERNVRSLFNSMTASLIVRESTPYSVFSAIVDNVLSSQDREKAENILKYLVSNKKSHVELIKKFEEAGILIPSYAFVDSAIPIDSIWYSFGDSNFLGTYLNREQLAAEDLDDLYNDGYINNLDTIIGYLRQQNANIDVAFELVKGMNTATIVEVINRTRELLPPEIVQYFYEKNLVTINDVLVMRTHAPDELFKKYLAKNDSKSQRLLIRNPMLPESVINALALRPLNEKRAYYLIRKDNFSKQAYRNLSRNPQAQSLLGFHEFTKDENFLVDLVTENPHALANLYRISEKVISAAENSPLKDEMVDNHVNRIRENNKRHEELMKKLADD